MNILTFDIEEWFHIRFENSFTTEINYTKFEPRLEQYLMRILNVLDEYDLKATFLCVGWIGKNYPQLIKEINDRGHEVGNHTYLHQLVHEMSPKQFGRDISETNKVLSDITGKPVRIFRAPAFSINSHSEWAFEIMHENGIEIDLSIFPGPRSFGGYKEAPSSEPYFIKTNGALIKEYPMSTSKICTKQFAYSGGGYFRMLPLNVIQKLIDSSNYNMMYFHARDFDSDQPILPGLSATRKFKSYYGIKNSWNKFIRILDQNQFISISQAENDYPWNSASIYSATDGSLLKASH